MDTLSTVASKHDVAETVKSLIGRIGENIDAAALNGAENLNDDLGIDSLSRIDLVVALEKNYNVVFTEEQLVDVATVDDLVRVVAQVVAAAP